MIAPLDELLAQMQPHLPRVLVSEYSFARAMEIARVLPDISGGICLECRLGRGDSRVDFIICALAQDGGREAFPVDPPTPLSSPLWERVFAFCKEWRNPASMLHTRIPMIWLEFDMDESASPILRPLPFACIQPWIARGPPGRRDPMAQLEDQGRTLAWRSLELLGEHLLTSSIERTVSACFEQLPDGAHLMHLAPLTSRKMEAVRVVASLHKNHVPNYLSRLGWPGSSLQVKEILEHRLEFWNHVDINVDVQESVLPDVGFGWQLSDIPNDPRTRLLLDGLVEDGLCDPEKRDALLQWPGREEAVLNDNQWPSTLCRTLGFKLVHRHGAPIEAKAYLYFENRFSLLS
ncbi:hypothetical protein ACN28S_30465 [Cystobacter fuscus]